VSWSHDDNMILFTCNLKRKSGSGSLQNEQICTISADGSDLKQLSDFPGNPPYDDSLPSNPSNPIWSPDGEKIIYRIGEPPENFDIDINMWVHTLWIMNADGSGKKRIIGASLDSLNKVKPTWSPDGKYIAIIYPYSSATPADGDRIAIIDPNGSNLKLLTEPNGYFGFNIVGWTPDSKKIIFVGPDEFGFTDHFTVDLDGNLETILFPGIPFKSEENQDGLRESPRFLADIWWKE